MRTVLTAAVALTAAAAAFALPSSALAQAGDPRQHCTDSTVDCVREHLEYENCDQPHSLDPPRFNCGPESVLNDYLAVLYPVWP